MALASEKPVAVIFVIVSFRAGLVVESFDIVTGRASAGIPTSGSQRHWCRPRPIRWAGRAARWSGPLTLPKNSDLPRKKFQSLRTT